MDIFSTLRISAKGLTAERLRMDLVAQNIANVKTTSTEEGGPYRRKVAVFKECLDKEISRNNKKFRGSGVEVTRVVADNAPPLEVYDPEHPDADENGYVLMPNINLANEMVDLISASRAYEANVTVLNATKNIANKALTIGKG